MVRRNITELALYQTEEKLDHISFEKLQRLYIEKPSETIYFVEGKILYGIVCMGEVLHSRKNNDQVKINKTFTVMTNPNVMTAYNIFGRNKKIYKIPIVNTCGELIGDYSRWEDHLYIEQNYKKLMQKNAVRRVLDAYDTVYVVEPAESTDNNYLQLLEYLKCFGIQFHVLGKKQLGDKLSENAICIFLNEDERTSAQCLYRIEPYYYDIYGYDIRMYDLLAVGGHCKVRMATYKSILFQIKEQDQLERLQIGNFARITMDDRRNGHYKRLDEKAVAILSALEQRGIRCFCIQNFENERTEYGRNFLHQLNTRLKAKSDVQRSASQWTAVVDEDEFYGELYLQEDYRKGTAQKELVYGENAFEYKKNIDGKYFNVKDRRRKTCYQPEEYIGTIYFIGTCTFIGACVEDQYTIESYLQKKLLEKGYAYKVENCGSMIREDSKIDERLQEIDIFGTNDIVIYQPSGIGVTAGLKCISLEKIFEKYDVPDTWVANGYTHCGHKANQIISDSLFELIEPCLVQKGQELCGRQLQNDISSIMKEYVQKKYLSYCFSSFQAEKYNTIGAIVMNCNLFHKGHRQLIEQAINLVDFLIIFVIDDVQGTFSFENRFHLIVDGTSDLKNVLVVPNGDFVFSRNNFPEYYTQRYSMTTVLNAEYDIGMFADYIAEPLHITHRFVGGEPKGRIQKTYYEEMRRILPQKGIRFMEMPRMVVNGEAISTSQVQEYLASEEYDKAFALLPDSTKRYLMEQLNMKEDSLKK